MIKRLGAISLLSIVFTAGSVQASGLPPVKATDKNSVPACATPGRLMAYIKDRNPKLDPRFETIAADYMRVGQELKIRWDYAFFQMIVETGSLSYKSDGRSGDVLPKQNNFAGLGATGKGERGESFPDVTTGVTAHLQHLLMYAGEKIPDAVAERTRKVQEWGVLTSWQKGIKGPITFTDLTRKWAPGASDYGSNIEATAKRFYDDTCLKPDPAPELLAAVEPKPEPKAKVAADAAPEKMSGADLARRAIAEARADSASRRTSLGASNLAKAVPTPEAEATTSASISPAITVLNAPKAETSEKAAPEKPAAFVQASAGGLAKPSAPAATKCRVWQASYGGQKAIIIRSKSDGFVNYTVLDVNEGVEKREAEAYIQAYAKGGESVAEFGSQNQALDKAFDLCPEG